MEFDEREKELNEALALKSRDLIYKTISNSPGLHFREIQRRTGLATGSLQYHLDFLQKQHFIRMEKEGKFVRYYSVRGQTVKEESDKKIMSLLRQKSLRRIILYLLTKVKANNAEIASAIEKSPSTTSWHLDKLLKEGLIEKQISGRQSFFYLKNPDKARDLLISHKDSFFDSLVESFAELWEEEIDLSLNE